MALSGVWLCWFFVLLYVLFPLCWTADALLWQKSFPLFLILWLWEIERWWPVSWWTAGKESQIRSRKCPHARLSCGTAGFHCCGCNLAGRWALQWALIASPTLAAQHPELHWPIWHGCESPGWDPALPFCLPAAAAAAAAAPLKHSCLWAAVRKCKTKSPFVLPGPVDVRALSGNAAGCPDAEARIGCAAARTAAGSRCHLHFRSPSSCISRKCQKGVDVDDTLRTLQNVHGSTATASGQTYDQVERICFDVLSVWCVRLLRQEMCGLHGCRSGCVTKHEMKFWIPSAFHIALVTTQRHLWQ